MYRLRMGDDRILFEVKKRDDLLEIQTTYGYLSISLCFQWFWGFRWNDIPTDDKERPDAKPDPIPVNPAP